MNMRELISIDDPKTFERIQAFSALFNAVDRAKQTLPTLKNEVDEFGLRHAIDTAQRVYDTSVDDAEINAAADILNGIVDRYMQPTEPA